MLESIAVKITFVSVSVSVVINSVSSFFVRIEIAGKPFSVCKIQGSLAKFTVFEISFESVPVCPCICSFKAYSVLECTYKLRASFVIFRAFCYFVTALLLWSYIADIIISVVCEYIFVRCSTIIPCHCCSVYIFIHYTV